MDTLGILHSSVRKMYAVSEQGTVSSGSAAGCGTLNFHTGRGDGTQVASAFGEVFAKPRQHRFLPSG